jgi:dihydroorotase-like cyclic amidohydrolase
MDLIIRNARIVSDGATTRGDIGVRAGRVAAVGDLTGVEAAEEHNARGQVALPGLVDPLVSLLGEGPHCPPAEASLQALTAEALLGGVTTLGLAVEFPLEVAWKEAREQRASDEASRALVDVAPIYAVTEWSPKVRAHLAAALEAGLRGVYACRSPLRGEGIVHALLSMAPEGATVFTQVSDTTIERFQRQQLRAEGRVAPGDQGEILPPWAEAAALRRLAAMLDRSEARLALLGISSRAALEELARLREQGPALVLLAKLAHLALSQEAAAEDSHPLFPHVWPPLRARADQNALWAALDEGLVAAVASGHHPVTSEAVAIGQQDVTEAATGTMALAHMLPLLHSEGPAKWRVDLETLSQCACADPAKLLGLYPRKGRVAPGSDADIVLLDTEAEGACADRGARHGLHDAFAGMERHGEVAAVFLRGVKVAGEGATMAPQGKFL